MLHEDVSDLPARSPMNDPLPPLLLDPPRGTYPLGPTGGAKGTGLSIFGLGVTVVKRLLIEVGVGAVKLRDPTDPVDVLKLAGPFGGDF